MLVGSGFCMKKGRKKMVLISGVSFLVAMVISFVSCMLLSPKIYLEEGDLEVVVHSEFEDPGYQAYYQNRDISDKVQVHGRVETDKVGEYSLEYEIDWNIFHDKKVRKVKVIDEEAPVLELKGSKEVVVCPNQIYEEEGYSAVDDYDGDLTDKVEVIYKSEKIIYKVADTSGNETTLERNIQYQDQAGPNLTLKGNAVVTLVVGSNYVEEGYSAIDDCDGDLTDLVEVTGKVNSKVVGTYTLTYKVQDSSHHESVVTRTVKVVSRESEVNDKGVIYLTFDDGPSSSITPEVLTILKEEGVKATFFVIHHSEELDYLIKREVQEGHTVALHSYSHNYASVYQSSNAYFQDLEKISDHVFRLTGQRAKIIRFPGGSSNTISKRYQSGIMSSLTREVVERGYHYFDWNVGSGDAGDVHSSEEVYQNVVRGLSKRRSNVVLMHDFENNYYTLRALRDIIRYGKSNGYVFDKITMDTPMVTHRVAN